MAVGSDENINIFSIENNQFKKIKTLLGHINKICCLLFSKLHNWLISADGNFIIGMNSFVKLWKEENNDKWILGK